MRWADRGRLAVVAAAVVASVATSKVSHGPKNPTIVRNACGDVRLELVEWNREHLTIEALLGECRPAAVRALLRMSACDLAPEAPPVIADGSATIRFAGVPKMPVVGVGIQLDDDVVMTVFLKDGELYGANASGVFPPAEAVRRCTADALRRARGGS